MLEYSSQSVANHKLGNKVMVSHPSFYPILVSRASSTFHALYPTTIERIVDGLLTIFVSSDQLCLPLDVFVVL